MWEYKILNFDYNDKDRIETTEKLNMLGQEGWEMVSCELNRSSLAVLQWIFCVFKRSIS